MTNPYRSLEEHVAKLQTKGYLSVLGPSGGPPAIQDLLTQGYKEYSDLVALTGHQEHFALVVSRKFDQGQDNVQFRLLYRLDPAQEGMHLFAMSARMAEVKLLRVLGHRGEIAPAASIYYDLVQQRTKRIVHWLTLRDVNPIKKMKSL
jgi:hypothetical protein